MKKNYKFWLINLIILVSIETVTIVLFETFYCLDKNNNSVCDKDETIVDESDITTPLNGYTVFVSKVIDGDTIELKDGVRIRLTGINAPDKGDLYYQEATDKLKTLVEGKTVILESDVEDKDSHCRPLRYVFVDDLFINLQLVKEGYATTYPLKPNIKYETPLANAEMEAKTSKIEIWEHGENLCNDVAT